LSYLHPHNYTETRMPWPVFRNHSSSLSKKERREEEGTEGPLGQEQGKYSMNPKSFYPTNSPARPGLISTWSHGWVCSCLEDFFLFLTKRKLERPQGALTEVEWFPGCLSC
jgi:hypothetical protein